MICPSLPHHNIQTEFRADARTKSVHTLKTLLETYLSQNPKPMPNLQEEATMMARDVLQKAGALPDGENAGGESSASTTKAPGSPATLPMEEPKRSDSEKSNVTVVHPGKS